MITFQNLLLASKKAQKGKRYRESTLIFNYHLEGNLLQLQEELSDQTYEPGPYKDFIISDSKRRLISAAPYRDRVVHHAVMNILEPLLDAGFIHDTYSCRKGKGTHAALMRFRGWFPHYRYVLKCDIRKYFPSIDHEILVDKLERKIGDKRAMWLLRKIVASKDLNKEFLPVYFPGDDLLTPTMRRRGIPVGNLTSQFFSNFFLDDFDHWIKEEKGIRPYLRYCDDFCLFGNDKSELNELKGEIGERLVGYRLALHDRKSRIYTPKEGVEFLGFRHWPDRVRVRKENTIRFRKRMKDLQKGYRDGVIPLDRVRASIVSWVAHASYADSWRLRGDLINTVIFQRGSA